MNRTVQTTLWSLLTNILFSLYHLGTGILWNSWWLLTLGCYYLILSIVRFCILHKRKITTATMQFMGVMLIMLSLTIAGTVILSTITDRGHKLHEILMIAMAVYAFSKITIAIINFFKARGKSSNRLRLLRNISLAHAFVSIFALQRSMLVSFGDMTAGNIILFNSLTGAAVWMIVLYLGINLIIRT